MTLALGHITYINCAPFFHYLPQAGFKMRIVPGVPAYLNQLLASGTIDVSPSSSFEYARNWQDYLLLPGHSISSWGPVKSVLLFSSCPIEELEGRKIALTGESATSVNLLKILLREYLQLKDVVCLVSDRPVEEVIGAGGAALLIGDRALKAALENRTGCRIYDLGELWYRFTGLPFVFALWILRRDSAREKGPQIRSLLAQLGYARARAFSSLAELADSVPEKAWMGQRGLVDYWRCMSYDLNEEHLAGLRLFFKLAHKHGLLAREAEIRFFE